MDPHANIKEQVELARQIIEGDVVDSTDVERLAELVLSLDEWRQRGGFDPYENSDKQIVTLKGKLDCYAPGDGSLAFSWSMDGKATGHLVNESDVDRFLEFTQDGQRLKERGFKKVCLNGQWCLIHDVKRTGHDTLEMDGKEYKYIDCWSFQHQGLDVRNIGIGAALRHFLRYEEDLTMLWWIAKGDGSMRPANDGDLERMAKSLDRSVQELRQVIHDAGVAESDFAIIANSAHRRGSVIIGNCQK